jgi:hypothetical protein
METNAIENVVLDRKATLKEIMDYMGGFTLRDFRDQWQTLSEEDKNFYQVEVARALA